jgi:hypothetical protein
LWAMALEEREKREERREKKEEGVQEDYFLG